MKDDRYWASGNSNSQTFHASAMAARFLQEIFKHCRCYGLRPTPSRRAQISSKMKNLPLKGCVIRNVPPVWETSQIQISSTSRPNPRSDPTEDDTEDGQRSIETNTASIGGQGPAQTALETSEILFTFLHQQHRQKPEIDKKSGFSGWSRGCHGTNRRPKGGRDVTGADDTKSWSV